MEAKWITKQTALVPTKTKHKGERVVTVPTPIAERLLVLKAEQAVQREEAGDAWTDQHELMFTTPTGAPLAYEMMRKAWRKALAASGVDVQRLYNARHTAATNMLALGVDIVTLSKTLGHSTITTTADRYLHPQGIGGEHADRIADAYAIISEVIQ